MLYSLAMEAPARYATPAPADAVITEKVHFIRGQKVMLDRDLAELYGVEVKRLKEQVRRNIERFPQDFMFELTVEETEASRSQNATLKRGENIKYLPFAFTEHGILMLANVLRSEQAIAVSTCLPAGRSTSSRSSPVCARCCFRTGISSRSWNNSRAASPGTTRRSRPSSITSRPWSRLLNNRAARSGSGPVKHDHHGPA
jgi:hypothetical protein